jgi:hypothetical protein
LTVEQVGVGPKKVSRLSWYDPLQGPRLICEIRLEDTSGEVNESREVELDLKRGTNFRVTFASTAQEQKRGGEFYEELFELLAEDKQRFLIGRLEEFPEGAALQPDKFRLRALSAQPASVDGVDGAGEGAILLFIGTVGNEPGRMPDKDAKWIYPIPAGRTSTLLLSDAVVVRGLLRNGAASVNVWCAETDFINDGPGGSVSGMFLSQGQVFGNFGGLDYGVPEKAHFHYRVKFTNNELNILRIDRIDEEFVMSWSSQRPNVYGAYVGMGFDGPIERWISFIATWTMKSRYHFVLNPDTGGVRLEIAGPEEMELALTKHNQSLIGEPHKTIIYENTPLWVTERLLSFQQAVADGTGEIELFRLYGLLFSGSNVVEHRAVRMGCDLAVFGDISPMHTTFQLDPTEKDVVHGGSFQFQVRPPHAGLTWTLEEVPGFGGPLGSITQSGAYTAPAAAEIPINRAYTMARVIATSSDGTLTSAALVRVVRRSVVVNPLVVGASQDSPKVRFSAGALGGGKLTWSVESATGGTLTDDPPEDDTAVFDVGDMFYLPGSGSTGGYFSVDGITVTDEKGNSAAADLILLEQEVIGSVVMMPSADLPEGQVQLALDTGKEMVTDGATWEVIAGSGTVDANGVYTLDTEAATPYAVISAAFDTPYVYFTNYIILPIPLVDLGEIQRAIS